MTDKSLQDKAIKIKGNDYVLVSDRINFFNDNYKNGFIQTHLVSNPDAEMVVIKAKVTPDIEKPDRYFTGYSQAKWGEGGVNETSALENCETSAVGRALGMMGIGVIDSVASVDEMSKAGAYKAEKPASGLTMKCKIHKEVMTERVSKKTGKPYFAHKHPTERGLCFGKSEENPERIIKREEQEDGDLPPF